MLLKKPGGEAYVVGTRAAVVDVLRRLPDGRMHIAVEGGERFRLLELHDERSFLQGTIEPVADEDDPPAAPTSRGRSSCSGRLQQTVGSTLDTPDAGSPLLDFEIVSRGGLRQTTRSRS